MSSLTVTKARLSMRPVPVRPPCNRMHRILIPCNKPCQVHLTTRWFYRQQLTHRSTSPWRRLVRTSILCPMAHTFHSVWQSMETFANIVQVASGGTQDDFVHCSRGPIYTSEEKVFLPVPRDVI